MILMRIHMRVLDWNIYPIYIYTCIPLEHVFFFILSGCYFLSACMFTAIWLVKHTSLFFLAPWRHLSFVFWPDRLCTV